MYLPTGLLQATRHSFFCPIQQNKDTPILECCCEPSQPQLVDALFLLLPNLSLSNKYVQTQLHYLNNSWTAAV